MSSALRNAVAQDAQGAFAAERASEVWIAGEEEGLRPLRAKDFHKKEDALNALKRKAAYRNPDEFYLPCAAAKTEDGVHVARSTEQNKHGGGAAG